MNEMNLQFAQQCAIIGPTEEEERTVGGSKDAHCAGDSRPGIKNTNNIHEHLPKLTERDRTIWKLRPELNATDGKSI